MSKNKGKELDIQKIEKDKRWFIMRFMGFWIIAPQIVKLIRDYGSDGAYEHLVEWFTKLFAEWGEEFPSHYEEALREYIDHLLMITIHLGFCYDRRKKNWILESLTTIEETFDTLGIT